MVDFINILISGLSNGAIYALCALGFTLAYNSSGALNLLQGSFIAFGGLFTYEAAMRWHMPTFWAVVVAVLIVTAIAGAFQAGVLGPVRDRMSDQTVLLIVIGGLIAAQGLATVYWGNFSYSLVPFTGERLSIGQVDIPTQALWIVGGALVVCTSLWLVLARTTVGKSLRAMAQNKRGARSIGLKIGLLMLISFALTGALGGVAGALVTPYLSMTVGLMAQFSLLGIIAISLGGYGSYFGAVTGGLALGVIEALATGYVSSLFGESILFGVLVVILIVRPNGLSRGVAGGRGDTVGAHGLVHYVEKTPPRLGRPALGLAVVFMVLLPFLGLSGQLESLDLIAVTAIALIGMDVLIGYIGLIPIGQSAFMSVGGFAAGISMLRWGVSPLVGLLFGLALSVVLAGFTHLITKRLPAYTMITVTLAIVLLLNDLEGNLSITGSANGLTGVPSFSIAGFSFDSEMRYYYLLWSIVAVLGFGTLAVLRGRNGRVMKAIAYDERAAAALGANVQRFRFWTLVFGAVTAGMSGAFLGMLYNFISAGNVGLSESFTLLVATVVGGAGTLIGPVIGVALFTYLPQISQSFQVWSQVVQGALIVAVLALTPSGLLGSALNGLHRLSARSRRSSLLSVVGQSIDGEERHVGTSA